MSEERRRDDPDAQWNRERQPRGRKDTRRWCRGKVGVEHTPETVKAAWARNRPCRRGTWRRLPAIDWTCWHQRSCSTCGKILVPFLAPSLCPDLPDDLKGPGITV